MRNFDHVKRLVIKVGTSTLALANGKLNITIIKKLIKEMSNLSDLGYQIMFVTSGAVGAGMGKMNLEEKPQDLNEKRALASIGQVELMHIYEGLFYAHDKIISQLLLTKIDFQNEERFKNLQDVCELLLAKGIIPVINENDAVVANEIKVGDNDTLSALSCTIIGADLLIILSDIDGLYSDNPKTNKEAKLIGTVRGINDEEISLSIKGADLQEVSEMTTNFDRLIEISTGKGSDLGTGGMLTKLQAGKIANKNKTDMVITNGKEPSNISKILGGQEIGTLFCANN